MAHLEIVSLTKRFGPVTAVNDLTLEIADGEFLVLLGPNGAGKTTTLRCVAGLEKPDEGQVKFDGQSMNGVSPAERNVAFVFQSYALYPRKTVFQNIAFPLEARRLSKSEIERRVRQTATLLHIEHLLDRRPAQLSGGEQQRVALGRAMVRQARAFLMDEPLTNLDFKLRVEMRTELKRLHQEFHTTLFYVTNDQTEAMTMADRIAVLNEGRLQQVGSPHEVYNHPVTRFVASFIGFPRMNFLDCILTTEDTAHHERSLLRSPDSNWAIPVPDGVRDAIRKAGAERVILGIRPEDLTLKSEPQPDSLAGTVFVLEPLGDRTIVDVRLGEDTVKVKAPPDLELGGPGQPVWLTPDLDRLHVFDRETEQAVV
jgi:multiple sugar transport system ATP-binding protein